MIKNNKSIVVLRFSALGDVAMCVPVLLAFSKKYPQIPLVVVSKAFHAPLFAAIPNVTFIPVNLKGAHKGLWGMAKLFFQLRKENILAIADFHNVLRTQIITILSTLFFIKNKSIDKGRSEKKALIQPEKKVFKPLKHSVIRYADVFEKLGFPLDMSAKYFLQKMPNTISDYAHIPNHKITIGIAPFAQHATKRYPAQQMQKLIALLHTHFDANIMLFGGGQQEIKILEDWQKTMPFITIIAGKYSLAQELQIISNLDLMMAMDSANGHLAAIYGVPVITIWGFTHPYAGFTPYAQPPEHQIGPNRTQFPYLPTTIYGKQKAPINPKVFESITPEIILERVKTTLKYRLDTHKEYNNP